MASETIRIDLHDGAKYAFSNAVIAEDRRDGQLRILRDGRVIETFENDNVKKCVSLMTPTGN